MLIRGLVLVLLGLLAACAPIPSSEKTTPLWMPSPNFDQRRPNYVIPHQTTNDTADKALATLTNPLRKVSALSDRSRRHGFSTGR